MSSGAGASVCADSAGPNLAASCTRFGRSEPRDDWPPMKLGAFEIQVVEDERFGLDGSAMFGYPAPALGAFEPAGRGEPDRDGAAVSADPDRRSVHLTITAGAVECAPAVAVA